MTKHGSKDLNKQTGGGKMEKLKQIWKDIVFELFVGLAVWYIVGISDPIKRLKGIRNNHNWDTVNLFILQILVFVTIIGSIIIFFVKGIWYFSCIGIWDCFIYVLYSTSGYYTVINSS
jgi:hypothetical protein